ncbi:pyruvate carboxylase [Bacillus fonticola]|uniref:pyruvate carboxylase n=1 Tax=Bacillus fonticola TaxID=2728853 RepID=UPI001476318C|nr:pyruvate carboxylase [Bacillus fonticola]
MTKSIEKVLVANRGEIAIRIFRACTELNIRTVAIYSKEDSGAYHRYKADEAYLVGKGKKPIDAYLDIEDILRIAKESDVDAIHPGYGFLSENVEFARRCREEGIVFIGPDEHHLDTFGDKVKARQAAIAANVRVIPGSDGPAHDAETVLEFGRNHGFPIIIKAALGGGGRGMRIVEREEDVKSAFDRARSEAKASFGNDEVYVEKFVQKPKHIEVQILADAHGQVFHLYERDCSVQRRHQKVVEIAPSVSLDDRLRAEICEQAVALMNSIGYVNAGTVEFLVAGDEFYFIEVNPRIQVEHTITEMVTGVDLVQAQLYVAMGHHLGDPEIGLADQEKVQLNGYAIQSRVTTEDPANDFMPDTGKIMAYRSSGGFGVRLDAGNGFQGAVITPYYDSLLVKVSTWALTFDQARAKMIRNLQEFRIRGIKTNIAFLENVMKHEAFRNGSYNTSFIDTTPELFLFPKRKDRGTKMLTYISDITVNGFPGITVDKKPVFSPTRIPQKRIGVAPPNGTKQLLDEKGPEAVAEWVRAQKQVLLTDTTFRDAHQSLHATRFRTYDLQRVAEASAHHLSHMFSLEMWGGATFDVAYRFLKEDPWHRLLTLREKVPNVLFQMLLRASNAVGYKNYPDNLIREFVEKSSYAGVDVFRIFDSLNWVKGMEVAIDAVRQQGKLAEAAICYTGDILDPTRTKYNTKYYTQLAKELELQGAHILAIKDMAGLLKPEAAYRLISSLKESVTIPIHLHTHDTSGNGIAMYMKAIDAGVDIVDTAISTMAGMTSQPSMESLLYALRDDQRPNVSLDGAKELSHYWEDTRKVYAPFESGMMSPHPEIYEHEMPGGQYSNLQQQAKAVGLETRWDEVKDMYRRVNHLFGDIVKVTPSSKVVGDMALFMIQNDLDEAAVLERGATIDFPDSVIEMFKGELGQPVGGFPQDVQKAILKGKEPITVRPGELMGDIDFEQVRNELYDLLKRPVTNHEVISYCLYPKVFQEYMTTVERYGDVSVLDTATFLYGMRLGEEVEVEIETGKTLIVKLLSIGQVQADGTRVMYFELNGQPREVVIRDEHAQTSVTGKVKADSGNESHISATMPGTVIEALVKEGEAVQQGDYLLITEAMKMETTVQAPFSGIVEKVHVVAGDAIGPGDLLIEVKRK